MWTTRYEDERWVIIDVVAGTSQNEVIVLTYDEVIAYEEQKELELDEKLLNN
jgi:hypothetical protein